MPKNIVVCLDGTGNQVKAKANSNVVDLYSMLDLSDPQKQVAYYDPGVGTMGAKGAWTTWGQKLTKLLGLVFGSGIKTNLEEAFIFLMQHYQPGDRVFLFGFSRGAFTARGLTGLGYRAGVMRPGAENIVPYLVSAYTKGDSFSEDDWKRVDKFASTFSVRTGRSLALPVHFLGLWDSVKALGILRPDPKWPYTVSLPNAAHIAHAVSIDERRRAYAQYLAKPKSQSTILAQTWFAGVHSDVGGGFADFKEPSKIALKWMADRALDHGLLVSTKAYGKLCAASLADAQGPLHRNGNIWRILGFRRRRLPIPVVVHQSVRDRMDAIPDYRLGADLGQVTWDDPAWTRPHSLMAGVHAGKPEKQRE